MGYKLWLTIALIIVIILFLASIIEYVPSINGEQGGLSIIWQRNRASNLPCTGELNLITQSSSDGKCTLQADSVLRNCKKTRWVVYEGNECSGTYICDGNADEPESNWRCAWDINSGTYAFTLCAESIVQDTKSITC